MSTTNITQYLQTAYSDQRLHDLLCHAKDGKLGYGSCCCLIGIPTADHALQEAPGVLYLPETLDKRHYETARTKFDPLAALAESEFAWLSKDDAERREKIIPLVLAEIARREGLRAEFKTQFVIPLCGPDMDVPREVPYVGEFQGLARK